MTKPERCFTIEMQSTETLRKTIRKKGRGNMYTKYFITGATGFLGNAVIHELMKKNVPVYAMVLKTDSLRHTLPREINVVTGDVCDGKSVEDFFTEADGKSCVIHCAGIVSVASEPGRKIYDVNVAGTGHIVSQCIAHNVGKLVYVSSVHAIPEKPVGQIMDGNCVISPELVSGHYAKSKAAATVLVQDAVAKGLNASIVMPSGIIGPGDTCGGSISSMLSLLLSGKLPAAVRGGYDFVDVRDVAKATVSCTENGKAGKQYVLSGHYATIRDILETAKEAAGIKKRTLYLPLKAAEAVAPLYEKISLLRKRKLFFTPYSVAVLASNSAFDRSEALRDLDFYPRSLKETVTDAVVWLGKKSLPGRNAKLRKKRSSS